MVFCIIILIRKLMEYDVMQKKILISLGLMAVVGLTAQAFAHSTIYTDDLGRMHFLGKDPGAKTLQKIEDYDNPAQKDVTNVVNNNEQPSGIEETKVNVKKKPDKVRKMYSESAIPNNNQKQFWNIW